MAPRVPPAAPPDLGQALGPSRLDLLRRIGRRAVERGERAFVVGGTVRDLLLGRPAHDLDLMLVGDALELAAELGDELGGRVVAHPRFLSATWCTEQGLRIDLAAARRERYPRPGALPLVEPGGLADDLARRDFTINAMALSLAPSRFGRLHDPHGGRADVRDGRVRPLHAASFVEDPTRLFRAVRFAARLGFTIPKDVGRRMDTAVAAGALAALSATRLRREVTYLLDESSRLSAVELAAEHGLWRGIHAGWRPGAATGRRLQRLPELLRRSGLKIALWPPALATMLVELPAPGRRQIVTRLAPPRTAARLLLRAPAEAPAFLEAVQRLGAPEAPALDRAARGLERASLCVAGALAEPSTLRRAIGDYLERVALVKLVIDGRDLLAAGVPDGPQIARGLDAARREVLAGRAADREAQIAAALAALDTA